VRLLGPGGTRSIVAEMLHVRHQLLILSRSRQRAPKPAPLRQSHRRPSRRRDTPCPTGSSCNRAEALDEHALSSSVSSDRSTACSLRRSVAANLNRKAFTGTGEEGLQNANPRERSPRSRPAAQRRCQQAGSVVSHQESPQADLLCSGRWSAENVVEALPRRHHVSADGVRRSWAATLRASQNGAIRCSSSNAAEWLRLGLFMDLSGPRVCPGPNSTDTRARKTEATSFQARTSPMLSSRKVLDSRLDYADQSVVIANDGFPTPPGTVKYLTC